MANIRIIQGRKIGEEEIDLIRDLMAAHPEWNRTRLSRELCARWDWHNAQDLASHVLGLITRRIRADWQVKYGHPVHALETFVERSRFKGTCYRAANWRRLGETRGRTRNDRYKRIHVPVKDVYLYPLVANFRKALCDTPAPCPPQYRDRRAEPKGREDG